MCIRDRYGATPSYCYPPAMANMPFMAYPSAAYAHAAYGHMPMPPNGAMYDYMSAMSTAGMMDYSAFTAANNYGYPSNSENGGTGRH